jgi:hypothetical protein
MKHKKMISQEMYKVQIMEDMLVLHCLKFSDSLRLYDQSAQTASIDCTTGDKSIVIFVYKLGTQERKQMMH